MFQPRCESLESRRLLATTLAPGGALTITGTTGDDVVGVAIRAAVMRVSLNGVLSKFSAAGITSVAIDLSDGADRLDVGMGFPVYVSGGVGNDTLYGGSGNDSFAAGGGKDFVDGGPGNDRIDGGAGNDRIFGGDGDDRLYGSDAQDYIEGGIGVDRVFAGLGDDTVIGGSNSDKIYGQDGNDILNGGNGNDLLSGDAGDDNIAGGDGADRIGGGMGNDVLVGNAANDFLTGDEGDDVLNGGTEDDQLDGGIGNDVAVGGDGNDTLHGQDGNDLLEGQAGSDVAFGEAGRDSLLDAAGNDQLDGGDGNDSISGSDGNDTLRGGGGDDWLDGGNNADLLDGADGADSLSGGVGRDQLFGGSGNDALLGGRDEDDLTGGDGADRFLRRIKDTAKDETSADVLFEFTDGDRIWDDAEIWKMDVGLAWLQQRTGGVKILKLSNGKDITIERNNDVGEDVLGDNRGDGTVDIADLAFQDPSLPPDIVIVHEIGHNWDDIDENPAIRPFFELSRWREQHDGSWTHDPNAQFPRNYGRTNPEEDYAVSLEAYYALASGNSTIYLPRSQWLSKWNWMDQWLNSMSG